MNSHEDGNGSENASNIGDRGKEPVAVSEDRGKVAMNNVERGKELACENVPTNNDDEHSARTAMNSGESEDGGNASQSSQEPGNDKAWSEFEKSLEVM